MSILLKATPDGLLLPIHAQPGARRNEIVGEHDGRLKVAVVQVAEKGKANKELLRLLAQEFGLSKSQVTLVAGETSSRKVVCLSGVLLEVVQEKLDRWLA